MMRASGCLVSEMENIPTCAIAIGNFDGFHLGHKKIVETLKEVAQEKKLMSMVLTFIPNPKLYFNREPNVINSDCQKKEILQTLDVDNVFFLDFMEILDMHGESFVKSILIDRFKMKYMVMGQNFKLGKNRDSDIESIRRMGERLGFGVNIVKPVILDGTRISSSLIREKLRCSEIEVANQMLGRMYYIDGKVTEGDKIGRQLGFPTINIDTENTLLPEGVFKTRVNIEGKLFESITNIGSRPTFAGGIANNKKVETHIFNFDQSVYGKTVRVFFEKKIRDEIKFQSKNHLIKQIKKDINAIKVDKGAFF